jgi:hypothetical protein
MEPFDETLDAETHEILNLMQEASTRPDFTWWGPMLKSLPQDDGTILHGGVWSSEVEDLQGDLVPQKMMEASYPYLRQWGKFDFDHGKRNHPQRNVLVGDVLNVGAISPEEALAQYGATITGTGSFVRGNLYAIPPEPDKAPQDLLDSRAMLIGGARMGYSADGKIWPGMRSARVRGAIATQLAIAAQPINIESTCCYMAKSLADGMGWLEDHPKDETPGAPTARVVIVSRGVSDMAKAINAEGYLVDVAEPTTPEEVVTVGRKVFDMMVRRLGGAAVPAEKSLEAGSGTDSSTFTGGRALTEESLAGGVKKEVPHGCKGHAKGCICAKCLVKRKRKMEKSRAKLGSGERFKEVEESARESGAEDPAAVAAAAGRKKLGKEKFQELAAKGRARAARKRMEKSLGELSANQVEDELCKLIRARYVVAPVVSLGDEPGEISCNRGPYVSIRGLYENYCIFSVHEQTYRQDYTAAGDGVTLVGEPSPYKSAWVPVGAEA